MTLFNILNTVLVIALAMLPCALAIYMARNDKGEWL